MLNRIWIFFFLSAFLTGIVRWLVWSDASVFSAMFTAMFQQAKASAEIAIGLIGVLSFWLGIMKIGEASGFIKLLTKALTPLFSRLMPEIPANHPALSAMVMNMAANMLGLDNAATPLGIKAMQEMQRINPHPDRASNAQILFLVLNTSSITLFPVTIFAYRAQLGAENPTDVFLPILLSTYMATLVGILAVATVQKIQLFDKVLLSYFIGLTSLLALMLSYFAGLDQAAMLKQSAIVSHLLLFSLIIAFIVAASYQRLNVYELFIEGDKQGFNTAVGIIPYLLALLDAFGVFRASGALALITDGLKLMVAMIGIDDRFIAALPTALLKPFSGSGARAMMIDTMRTYGADSFAGHLVSVVQGSTETTFYVLAVYFGSVNISNIRHAAVCGIIADLTGIMTAILISYWFFG